MTGRAIVSRHVDRSNLGRGFEKELDAVHEWYRAQGWADIVQNPNTWQIVSEKRYLEKLKLVQQHKAAPGSLAVCDNARKMMRVTSDVDFTGGGANFSICFDAKETKEDRLPMSSLRDHQIQRLVSSSRCGTIAGFMIRMLKHNRVFFVPAAYARRRENALAVQSGRRAKSGTASLSIEDLEANAIEIHRHKLNTLWDWLPVLVGGVKR
jgi:penicillin-binding protein-related factor A (putative recombinase)